MKKVKDIFNFLWTRYNHVLILSYYVVLALLYATAEKVTVPKYTMHSFIDDIIPFCKYFVIPYLMWYVYIILPMVYFGFTSKKDFVRLALFMFGGMTICYVVYFTLPNQQNLRPVITDTDIFSRIIKYLYTVDTPTNVAPSMHVLNSIAVHAAVSQSEKLRKIKWVQIISAICAILISLSTVFIKQHSIEDVLYAGLLGYALYHLIYRPWRKSGFQKKAVPAESKLVKSLNR